MRSRCIYVSGGIPIAIRSNVSSIVSTRTGADSVAILVRALSLRRVVSCRGGLRLHCGV